MKGATALDCEKTISSPNSTNTTTIGTSQYFFSCRMNCQSSETTRCLLITSSKHPRVMVWIAVTCGMRQPAVPPVAPAAERILSGDTPDEPDRHQDGGEEDRQEHARVHVPERATEPPPRAGGPSQER